MGETTAYLSPNGDNLSRGDGPATRLVVATVEGVATFRRGGRGAPWHLTDRSLSECHVGSLLFEPVSGKLFAGAHADGGLWVNDDEVGSWRRLTNGLDRPHMYSLAARRIGDRVTLFAGTEPAALYRSEDFGESWREAESLREVPGTDKWTFPPPPHLAHVKSVVFHPTRERTFYALVEQGALLQTDDDGQTWTELAGYAEADDIAYHDVHRLVISTNDPRLFYLATGEGLYRSGDGGQSWEHLMPRAGRIGYPDFLFGSISESYASPCYGGGEAGPVIGAGGEGDEVEPAQVVVQIAGGDAAAGTQEVLQPTVAAVHRLHMQIAPNPFPHRAVECFVAHPERGGARWVARATVGDQQGVLRDHRVEGSRERRRIDPGQHRADRRPAPVCRHENRHLLAREAALLRLAAPPPCLASQPARTLPALQDVGLVRFHDPLEHL